LQGGAFFLLAGLALACLLQTALGRLKRGLPALQALLGRLQAFAGLG